MSIMRLIKARPFAVMLSASLFLFICLFLFDELHGKHNYFAGLAYLGLDLSALLLQLYVTLIAMSFKDALIKKICIVFCATMSSIIAFSAIYYLLT